MFLTYAYLFCFVFFFLASACFRREYSDLLWYPAKVDVHFLQRETKDWYANISWTPLAGKLKMLIAVMKMIMMMQYWFARGFVGSRVPGIHQLIINEFLALDLN